MRQAKVGAAHTKGSDPLGGAAGEVQFRMLAGAAAHLDFAPANALRNAGAKCFGGGLFGTEARREAFCRAAALAVAVFHLCRSEDSMEEAIAKARDGVADPRNFHQVGAGAENHAMLQSLCRRSVAPWDGARRQAPAAKADRDTVNDIDAERNAQQNDLQPEPVELRLQCLTYDERQNVLPALTDAIDRAGGWLLERRTVAAHALELRLELQVRALVDIYAALVSSGVELTREAHLMLTERCTCRQYQPSRKNMANILSIRLEIAFLGDITLEANWMQWMSRQTATA